MGLLSDRALLLLTKVQWPGHHKPLSQISWPPRAELQGSTQVTGSSMRCRKTGNGVPVKSKMQVLRRQKRLAFVTGWALALSPSPGSEVSGAGSE